MSTSLHPARSSEFLSRLHDGEVPETERAAFDVHARTCAECREAVAAFDRALAAYRRAEPTPAAADLSARILRKIRAQSPSRRPFGVVFGIDLRWAGVSVAAVLALLVALPVLLRTKAVSRPAPPEALTARILVAETDAKAERQPEPSSPAATAEIAAPAPRPAPPARAAGPEKREFAASAPPPPPAGRPNAPAPAPAAAGALQKDVASEVVVSAEAPLRDAQSGAAPDAARRGVANHSRAKVAQAPALPVHVSVRASDQGGLTPAVLATPSEERLSALRGRELLVVVDASGRVVALETPPADKAGAAKRAAAEATDAEALDILRDLRFEPGQTTRRLVVKIE